MTWTYRFLLDNRSRRHSCYGLMAGKDRQHFVVLIGADGNAILRTERFPRSETLTAIISSIRQSCSAEACFDLHQHPGGSHYFIVKSFSGHTLAVSDMYADRATALKKIREVRELGKKARMYYLPFVKSQRREDT